LLCKPFAVSLTQNHPAILHTTSRFEDLHGKYDLIVDLRGSWRSLRYALLHRPAIRLDRGSVRFANMKKGQHPHEVITNLQVVLPVIDEKNQNTEPEIFVSQNDHQKAAAFLAQHHIGKFAVLHTGARRALRKWNKFDLLAAYLKQEKNLDIIFTGDQNDREEIETWQQKLSFKTYSVAGLLNLSEFAALVSKASIYAGNESGPLHIAAVCKTPSVGLFGPGEPHVFYPWGKCTSYVHHVLPCNPCDQIHCVHPDNPCINRIELFEVTEQLNKLIQH
jgi:ADP-heptose:LPS heptosyltransferase